MDCRELTEDQIEIISDALNYRLSQLTSGNSEEYQAKRIKAIKDQIGDNFGRLTYSMRPFLIGAIKDVVGWNNLSYEEVVKMKTSDFKHYSYLKKAVDLINLLLNKKDKPLILP